MRHSAEMSRLLRRWVAYLHTPQICGTCHGVKVGIHGSLNLTAANLRALKQCVYDRVFIMWLVSNTALKYHQVYSSPLMNALSNACLVNCERWVDRYIESVLVRINCEMGSQVTIWHCVYTLSKPNFMNPWNFINLSFMKFHEIPWNFMDSWNSVSTGYCTV
jgi:hypothetical protein